MMVEEAAKELADLFQKLAPDKERKELERHAVSLAVKALLEKASYEALRAEPGKHNSRDRLTKLITHAKNLSSSITWGVLPPDAFRALSKELEFHNAPDLPVIQSALEVLIEASEAAHKSLETLPTMPARDTKPPKDHARNVAKSSAVYSNSSLGKNRLRPSERKIRFHSSTS